MATTGTLKPANRPNAARCLTGAALVAVTCAAGACAHKGTAPLIPLAPYDSPSVLGPLYEQYQRPLVVIGSTVYLPHPICLDPGGRGLGGDNEGRGLGGDDEGRGLGGDEEGRRLGGDEEGRRLGGAEEGRRLGGDEEGRGLGGDDERRGVGGDDEGRGLGGDAAGRRLGGDTEGRGLGAGAQTLECRNGGASAFRILRHQRLDPRVFKGDSLTAVPSGYIEFH